MVKADPKCDYYADLELLPSAEAAEIKKQFKKLALKYHPDRNPGKELEFNSKFQAIQAAHEVLTDPQQRAKYDADRVRNGMSYPFTSPLRPNPPPRPGASNYPPPPRRTPQASTNTNFPPQPSSGTSRYTSHGRNASATARKSYAEQAQDRANAFKAWEQMRQTPAPPPPQARPVPPRPTKPTFFQPPREAGSYPPKDSPQRPPWDQTKEPHPGFPKMARSNTTRAPKKSGFAPGFSAGDEPPAKNTSAYFNISKGERPEVSRPDVESRPDPPPPPPNQRSNPKRPDHLKAFKPQAGVENPSTSSERISTPYATSGGEKTYFTSTGLGRSATCRDGPASGGFHDSESLDRGSSHTRNSAAFAQRGHHSASPKLRSPRPVSVSSISSSSSDESLREGVEQLYTSAEQAHASHCRTQNSHLKPSYKPFVQFDDEGKNMPPRGRHEATEDRSTSKQRQQNTESKIDPSLTEGFMEHRMKHEAERIQSFNTPLHSPPQANGSGQQRPLHRPKSWHEKYGPSDQDQDHTNESNRRPATGQYPEKPSMYEASGFDPSFLNPSSSSIWCQQWPFGGSKPAAFASSPKVAPPYWAVPSCIAPKLRPEAYLLHQNMKLRSKSSLTNPFVESADLDTFDSFSFPKNPNGQPAHPPPLRSHSSDTISVNFSPSDWHGRFTGKPEQYFEYPQKQAHSGRGRTSPTKRPVSPLKKAHRAPSVERHKVPVGDSQAPPQPPEPAQQQSYSPDKWAPYFRPGTLNWPPPPPPAGSAVRVASRKRAKTPSRRGSRNVFKRPAIPKPAGVASAVNDAGDEATSSNLESGSSQSSGNGSAMDLDMNMSPPDPEKKTHNGLHGIGEVPGTTPRPSGSHRTGPPPLHQSQEKDELDLGNLKNVAPLAPNQQGIEDLNDLSTTLPFESRASARPAAPPSPQLLELPKPPKAPPAPEKPTQPSWQRYAAAMRIYIAEWNVYNTKMLNHFNERQASAEMTLKPEWMSAVGEGTEQWGYKKYMQGVEEDFRVREHWDVSWERHRECMRMLGSVRESLLESSSSKILP
ncbi:MAG: hypothetical protein Q9219_003847 [cf. Caloplaca sp. 3 TL-2023]